MSTVRTDPRATSTAGSRRRPSAYGAAAAIAAALVLVATSCTGSGNSTGPSGVVNIVLWHGYGKVAAPGETPNLEATSMQELIDAFNATHPTIHVDNVYCCSNDDALQKLTVALQGGEQPDIAYEYGSSMPQLATTPKIMDLTELVKDPTFQWDDFFPGARAAATVDGRVLGVPALIDNLAIVYNRDMFDAAGLTYPTPDWTWGEFRAAAKALTDPATKTFGWALPSDASEDTVWHFDAMLWEGGGDILTPDGKHAAFDSPSGVAAATTLRDMAFTDGSVYLDLQGNPGKVDALFNSGKIGMMVTGPWALGAYPDVHYGVQVMPSFPGGDHETIAGPDDWVLFDNGPARSQAAWEFMKWFTAADQVLKDCLLDGHLPTRQSVLSMPGFAAFGASFPGVDVFAQNLQNVLKARPQLSMYPQLSQAMGNAIVAVLLGQKDPQQALDEAAQQVNGILSAPG